METRNMSLHLLHVLPCGNSRHAVRFSGTLLRIPRGGDGFGARTIARRGFHHQHQQHQHQRRGLGISRHVQRGRMMGGSGSGWGVRGWRMQDGVRGGGCMWRRGYVNGSRDEKRGKNGDRVDGKRSQPAPTKPVTKTLEAAREHTKTVRNKVRSSLTSLTPHENIYNLPNFLTVTRLVAAPATAYLLLHDHHAWALGLFAYAGITDLVDGWLARKWKLQTVAGSVIDPMADKALMIILTVTLAVKGAIPMYLATLILGRDASLAIAAIYYRFASLPAPKTFLRYWDFSLPSAEVHPTTVSKYNTFLQLILIGSTLALPVVVTGQHHTDILHSLGLTPDHLHSAMHYFQLLVAGTTAWSGLSYAYLKNVVTILGFNEELKAKQGARGRAIIGVTFGSCVLAAMYFASTVDNSLASESKNSRADDMD